MSENGLATVQNFAKITQNEPRKRKNAGKYTSAAKNGDDLFIFLLEKMM